MEIGPSSSTSVHNIFHHKVYFYILVSFSKQPNLYQYYKAEEFIWLNAQISGTTSLIRKDIFHKLMTKFHGQSQFICKIVKLKILYDEDMPRLFTK